MVLFGGLKGKLKFFKFLPLFVGYSTPVYQNISFSYYYIYISYEVLWSIFFFLKRELIFLNFFLLCLPKYAKFHHFTVLEISYKFDDQSVIFLWVTEGKLQFFCFFPLCAKSHQYAKFHHLASVPISYIFWWWVRSFFWGA